MNRLQPIDGRDALLKEIKILMRRRDEKLSRVLGRPALPLPIETVEVYSDETGRHDIREFDVPRLRQVIEDLNEELRI